jgi:uncharacterized protein YecT (DUF1311 family)
LSTFKLAIAMADALESSVGFLKASSEVVASVLHPGAPLTQADTNEMAAKDLKAADQEVDEAHAALAAQLDDNRRPKLESSQVAWRHFQRLHAKFEAGRYEGGSTMPLIYASAAKAVADERLEALKGFLN